MLNSFFQKLKRFLIVWLFALLNCVLLFVTSWTVTHQTPLSMRFPRHGSGLHLLLQGIILAQGLNPHLPTSPALHVDSFPLSYWACTSCEMPGRMNYKLESRLQREVTTSDMQMIPLYRKSV